MTRHELEKRIGDCVIARSQARDLVTSFGVHSTPCWVPDAAEKIGRAVLAERRIVLAIVQYHYDTMPKDVQWVYGDDNGC
jgi:hypothetical protein